MCRRSSRRCIRGRLAREQGGGTRGHLGDRHPRVADPDRGRRHRELQPVRVPAQPDQGCVGQHRHRAASAVRPDPEPRSTVQGYAAHEKQVFEDVTKARAMATAATGSPAAQAAAEGPFVAALRQAAGRRRELPGPEGEPELPRAAGGAVQHRGPARRPRAASTTRNVRDYNRRVQSFPSMIVARFGNFPLEEFFEVDESLRGDAGVPKVDFSSMGQPAGAQPAAPAAPAEPPARRPPAGRWRRRAAAAASAELSRAIRRRAADGPARGRPRPAPANSGSRRTVRVSSHQIPAHATATPPARTHRGSRPDAVGEGGHDEARGAERERDQREVEREDPSADVVGHESLEAVGRQHPLRPAAEVRDEDRRGRQPERRREPEQRVADAEHGEASTRSPAGAGDALGPRAGAR